MQSHRRSVLNILTLVALLVSLLGSALVFTPAHASGISVNSGLDVVSAGDGKCTLREAIISANNDSPSGIIAGECASGSGNDSISFTAGYLITLGGVLPDVYTTIAIYGLGTGTTIIQASTCDPVNLALGCTPAAYPVVNVLSGGGELTLNNLTVEYGNSSNGGGIHSAGVLNLNGVSLANNHASGDGGGVYSTGALNVQNSTFSSNKADEGGGIWSNQDLYVIKSTFLANEAVGNGGGVANTAGAGTRAISNSTFYTNTAGYGGGLYTDGSLSLTGSSFARNSAAGAGHGGGIWILGSLSMKNTMVVKSLGGAEDCYNSPSDLLADNTSNLIETNAASPNKCGSPAVEADPGPLTFGSNGGPTQTLAITPASPAFSAGNNDTCANYPVGGQDQRGEPRQGR